VSVRAELLQLAADLTRRGEPFALATVVNREAPISAQVGDVALVTRDGTFHGWVGGSCTRPTVVAEAARALEEGRPRLIALTAEPEGRRRPGLTLFPMTCHSGGSVEIYIQPVLPAPRLLVYGASPTARALARLGTAMGYRVEVVDPGADAAAFPGAAAVYTSPPPPDPAAPASPAPRFAVVATQGLWDEEAVQAAAAHGPDYLAVVASPRRFAEMRTFLAARLPAATLDAIHNPAGLDLGALGPEEVALSVLAEIVKERRQARPPRAQTWGPGGEAAQRREAPSAAHPDSLRVGIAEGPGGEAAQRREAPSAAHPDSLRVGMAEEALDPICGMTVATRGAQHTARHDGQDYFFCCAGCRERFVAAPERYLAGASGR
jgi:xanthine dehydrogenase accessory factor